MGATYCAHVRRTFICIINCELVDPSLNILKRLNASTPGDPNTGEASTTLPSGRHADTSCFRTGMVRGDMWAMMKFMKRHRACRIR